MDGRELNFSKLTILFHSQRQLTVKNNTIVTEDRLKCFTGSIRTSTPTRIAFEI